MAMKDIIFAVALVLALNTVLFLAQQAIVHIDPESEVSYFVYEGSNIESYDAGDYNLREFDSADDLPSVQTTVTEDGNFFTDTFAALKNWLLDNTGLGYLLNIINTIPNFLRALGLPPEVSFALGYFFHALSVFLVIAWLKS